MKGTQRPRARFYATTRLSDGGCGRRGGRRPGGSTLCPGRAMGPGAGRGRSAPPPRGCPGRALPGDVPLRGDQRLRVLLCGGGARSPQRSRLPKPAVAPVQQQPRRRLRWRLRDPRG
ncbi:MAG TPA: hypothetical protein ENK18_14650 [Deltaproteobacteria bacterium]|nr:hypothetical protein [Deltaproteobacteria bacterium]